MPTAFHALLATIAFGVAVDLAGQGPTLAEHRARLPAGQAPAVAGVLADFDGDGLPDLARAGSEDFGVWIQSRAGVFDELGFQRLAPSATPPPIVALAAGRFVPTSKHADLVVGYGDGSMVLYPNTGSGLGKAVLLPALQGSLRPVLTTILSGDLDRASDGLDELVLVLSAERPVVYTNSGGTSFRQARVAQGPNVRAPRAALGDVDRDGDIDLLIVTELAAAPAPPALYLNSKGSLSIDASAFPQSLTLAAGAVWIGPVLGQASSEIVLAPVSTTGALPVEVYRDSGAQPGQPRLVLLANPSALAVDAARDLVAADIDLDGFDDLVLIAADGGVVWGANGGSRSPGVFGPAASLLDPAPHQHLLAADLDGDRDVDLVVLGAGIEDRLLLGGPPALPPLALDTESACVPIASRSRYVSVVTDVTGEGDADIVMWSDTGAPSLLRNVDGQARFVEVQNPASVPTLPPGPYTDAQNGAVTGPPTVASGGGVLVLGKPSPVSPTGMRVLVRGVGAALIDDTTRRWLTSTVFQGMTVADVVGRAPGSAGTRGLSDVVGVDNSGQLSIAVNAAGVYSTVLPVAAVRFALASHVLVGDVDRDGFQDLLVVEPGQQVSVFLAVATRADSFVLASVLKVAAIDGVLHDVTGDLLQDLLLVVPTAATGLSLLVGDGRAGFSDRTALHLPKLTVLPDQARRPYVLGSLWNGNRSIVVPSDRGPDHIMVGQAGPGPVAYGPPEPLPLRGSRATRTVHAVDLDLDGDQDLVVCRYDSNPAVLLGQVLQLSHVGRAQAGREARIVVGVPHAASLVAIGIGPAVARIPVPGLGMVRLGGMLPTLLAAGGTSPQLQRIFELPLPQSLGNAAIPMQILHIDTRNGSLRLGNLDVFRSTSR